VVEAIVGSRRHRQEERTMRAASLAALGAVGLAERGNHRAAALPYGHRRLLEIARALVAKPRLLLLDEPAAGLNASEATTLVDLIGRINQQGVTILLVEHQMDVIMAACSSITVLNYGRKLAEGAPAEIRADANVIEAYLGRPGLEQRLAAHA
jgi:ABC-type branched-subunit amino acid transport system ATPase component